MAFDTKQLGRDILEIFFEAQRMGRPVICDEVVILAREEHRRAYLRRWKAQRRQSEYCENPPRTEFVECACGCGNLVPVKHGTSGRPRRFLTQACRKRFERANPT